MESACEVGGDDLCETTFSAWVGPVAGLCTTAGLMSKPPAPAAAVSSAPGAPPSDLEASGFVIDVTAPTMAITLAPGSKLRVRPGDSVSLVLRASEKVVVDSAVLAGVPLKLEGSDTEYTATYTVTPETKEGA